MKKEIKKPQLTIEEVEKMTNEDMKESLLKTQIQLFEKMLYELREITKNTFKGH